MATIQPYYNEETYVRNYERIHEYADRFGAECIDGETCLDVEWFLKLADLAYAQGHADGKKEK